MPIRDKDLHHWGVPEGEATALAEAAVEEAAHRGTHKGRIRRALLAVLFDPEAYRADPIFGVLATHLHALHPARRAEGATAHDAGELFASERGGDGDGLAHGGSHGAHGARGPRYEGPLSGLSHRDEGPHGGSARETGDTPEEVPFRSYGFASRSKEARYAAAAPHGSEAPRDHAVPWKQYGPDPEPSALQQMVNACRLPVAVVGALMPDAHQGYGLPIGGVLATRNAVIPYAVGVDIACRMKLTVLDLPVSAIGGMRDRLRQAIEAETRFGVGAEFRPRREHDVMDDPAWLEGPVTRQLRDKAWTQLGTSGSGNHFVEYGVLTVLDAAAGLPPGEYLALLSHSGSRGTGNQLATHYSDVAMRRHPGLPKEMSHLAWLDLDSADGQEYWHAMELMGRYASANHALIHRSVARYLGARVLLDVENHHNFAWKERVGEGRNAETLVVHRKGATPAHAGVLGVIPGTMATPGYIVRGLGNPESLNSASHGAGRAMSRSEAKRSFTWSEAKKFLAAHNVTLISAGLDEVPMAYKNIEEVMAAQTSLVEVLARFDPRLVKMAEGRERAED